MTFEVNIDFICKMIYPCFDGNLTGVAFFNPKIPMALFSWQMALCFEKFLFDILHEWHISSKSFTAQPLKYVLFHNVEKEADLHKQFNQLPIQPQAHCRL